MRDASMSRWTIGPYLMGLLGYAIKIAATWVAGKNCETFYTTHPTPQHRAIFITVFRLLCSNLGWCI